MFFIYQIAVLTVISPRQNVYLFILISHFFFKTCFHPAQYFVLFNFIIFAGFQVDVYKFLIFTLTLLLTSLCACGLSFFVSAGVSVFAIANLLVALPYVFMMVSRMC